MSNIVTDLFVLGVFAAGIYAFLILPRQREFRRRQKLVRELAVGTEVLTYGGMLGKILSVDKETGVVTLEIAEGVEARFLAAGITNVFDEETYAKDAKHVLD